ncbi:hypothetical protein ACHAQH_004822 [Verticillium albo-atrum]
MIPAEMSPSKGTRGLNFGEDRAPDAQEFYSSEFCVFVANLPQSQSDETLEAAVTEAFSKFGTVFVKIRRDNRNQMPYGFAQFTNAQHARSALMKGKGTMILGRACRTERVKGNCQFVLFRRDGSVMTRAEVTNLMKVQGTLARVEPLHSQTQVLTNFPETAWLVTYDLFDPRRDVVGVFANHMTYSARPFNQKETPDRTAGSGANHHAFMGRYEPTRRSVFIANLPDDIDELTIRAMTSEFGRVLRVHVRQTVYNNGPRAYAFVEFDRADIPDTVIEHLNGTVAPDNQGCLRVQRKTMHPYGPSRPQGLRSAQTQANTPVSLSAPRFLFPQIVANPVPAQIDEREARNVASPQETPVKKSQQQELKVASDPSSDLGQVTPTNAVQPPPPGVANPMSPMSSMSPMSPMSPWVQTSPYGNPFAAAMGYSPFAGSQYTMMTPQASPAMYYPQQSPQPHFSPFVMAPQMPQAFFTGSWAPAGHVPGSYMVEAAVENQTTEQDSNIHNSGVDDPETGHSQGDSEGGASLQEE